MEKGKPKRTDIELKKRIIERLKELRSERNYSQEYVIEHTRENLSQYKAGIRLPSLDSLVILCKLYGITLKKFFESVDYPKE